MSSIKINDPALSYVPYSQYVNISDIDRVFGDVDYAEDGGTVIDGYYSNDIQDYPTTFTDIQIAQNESHGPLGCIATLEKRGSTYGVRLTNMLRIKHHTYYDITAAIAAYNEEPLALIFAGNVESTDLTALDLSVGLVYDNLTAVSKCFMVAFSTFYVVIHFPPTINLPFAFQTQGTNLVWGANDLDTKLAVNYSDAFSSVPSTARMTHVTHGSWFPSSWPGVNLARGVALLDKGAQRLYAVKHPIEDMWGHVFSFSQTYDLSGLNYLIPLIEGVVLFTERLGSQIDPGFILRPHETQTLIGWEFAVDGTPPWHTTKWAISCFDGGTVKPSLQSLAPKSAEASQRLLFDFQPVFFNRGVSMAYRGASFYLTYNPDDNRLLVNQYYFIDESLPTFDEWADKGTVTHTRAHAVGTTYAPPEDRDYDNPHSFHSFDNGLLIPQLDALPNTAYLKKANIARPSYGTPTKLLLNTVDKMIPHKDTIELKVGDGLTWCFPNLDDDREGTTHPGRAWSVALTLIVPSTNDASNMSALSVQDMNGLNIYVRSPNTIAGEHFARIVINKTHIYGLSVNNTLPVPYEDEPFTIIIGYSPYTVDRFPTPLPDLYQSYMQGGYMVTDYYPQTEAIPGRLTVTLLAKGLPPAQIEDNWTDIAVSLGLLPYPPTQHVVQFNVTEYSGLYYGVYGAGPYGYGDMSNKYYITDFVVLNNSAIMNTHTWEHYGHDYSGRDYAVSTRKNFREDLYKMVEETQRLTDSQPQTLGEDLLTTRLEVLRRNTGEETLNSLERLCRVLGLQLDRFVDKRDYLKLQKDPEQCVPEALARICFESGIFDLNQDKYNVVTQRIFFQLMIQALNWKGTLKGLRLAAEALGYELPHLPEIRIEAERTNLDSVYSYDSYYSLDSNSNLNLKYLGLRLWNYNTRPTDYAMYNIEQGDEHAVATTTECDGGLISAIDPRVKPVIGILSALVSAEYKLYHLPYPKFYCDVDFFFLNAIVQNGGYPPWGMPTTSKLPTLDYDNYESKRLGCSLKLSPEIGQSVGQRFFANPLNYEHADPERGIRTKLAKSWLMIKTAESTQGKIPSNIWDLMVPSAFTGISPFEGLFVFWSVVYNNDNEFVIGLGIDSQGFHVPTLAEGILGNAFYGWELMPYAEGEKGTWMHIGVELDASNSTLVKVYVADRLIYHGPTFESQKVYMPTPGGDGGFAGVELIALGAAGDHYWVGRAVTFGEDA